MTYRSNVVMGCALLLCLSGCTSFFTGYGTGTRQGASSSLVDYLYPKGEEPPDVPNSIPHLDLPLRVGIAFVPGDYYQNDISEATKMELLESVKAEFIQQEYIAHIEVIPETYLRSGNGINGMRQVARLYGVDVMALVSYDQVSVSADNPASLLYWTIVGAYFIPGTNTEVQTFVDTAVFDVDTAQLLFRAPGVDSQEQLSTAIGSDDIVRRKSAESFAVAVGDMTTNLSTELVRFEEDVKNNPARAEVVWREGYGGGGAIGAGLLLLLPLLLLGAVRAGRTKGPSAYTARQGPRAA